MLNALTLSAIFVLDQDEALDFYVGTLGLEVKIDQDLGFMRWLTLIVPGEPAREILLEVPGPPAMDEATAEQVRELVTKGATSGWLGFTTDDCQNLRDVVGEGRRVHPGACPAGIRCRLRPARSVRQRDPDPPTGAEHRIGVV
jgi:catechol 2,3-dioxygenase-like lactoylglutathione lyase family enzyme